MSRFNTGNPLDSDALKDLSDNAKNADLFSNDVVNESYKDRFGRNRKTIHGMESEFDRDQELRREQYDSSHKQRENDFNSAQKDRDDRFKEFLLSSGYQFVGDYVAGVELTEYNQIVRDADGEFWRASGNTGLPYTLTGEGVPEQGNLVSVGDASLRQDLMIDPVNGGGAMLVEGSVITLQSLSDIDSLDPIKVKLGQVVQVDGLHYKYLADQHNPTYPYGVGGWVLTSADTDGMRYCDHIYVDTPSGQVLLGTAYGYLVAGASSGRILRSRDGVNWTHHTTVGFTVNSNQSAILETSDGEVIINTSTELRKSEGWAKGGTGVKFTTVLTSYIYPTGQARFHQGWGVRSAGKYVYATEYGNPKPQAHRGYLSTDYGRTFVEVFNLADHYTTGPNSNAHNHGACIDLYNGPTPRLWQFTADTGFIGVHYSDDLGGSWKQIPKDNFPPSSDLNEPPNYVVIDATMYGMVLGSDDTPNGTSIIRRDASYRQSPKVLEAFVFKDDSANQLTHVAQSQVVVGGLVYTLFERSGDFPEMPARVVATCLKSGQGRLIWEGDQPTSLRKVDFYKGELYLRDTLQSGFYKLTLYKGPLKQGAKEVGDPGNVLGGRAMTDKRTLACGVGSKASVNNATAVGARSLSDGHGALAVGHGAVATGAESVAIGGESAPGRNTAAAIRAVSLGSRAEATGDSSVALGFGAQAGGGEAVSLGTSAKATGANSTALGRRAESLATEAVAVGGTAKVTQSRGIALGSGSAVTGLQSIAVGYGSKVTASYSVAVGSGSEATHSRSVAVGSDSKTSDVNQVAIGARSVLIGESGANTPPPGYATLYVTSRDGSQELRVRFANGVIKVLVADT